jgi:hypothetical protein
MERAGMPQPASRRSLSVLVPALNEEEGLSATIEELLDALRHAVEDFEVIIINDGSTDRTRDIADQFGRVYSQVRVFHNARNMGLGYSYLRGLQEARKSHFAYVPGDNTWPRASIAEVFRHLGKADIVTSYATNPEVRLAYRRFVSAGYTRVLNFLFGFRMKYYNGLIIYPLAFLRDWPPTTHGFGFQSETLLKALCLKLSVVEVGVAIDETTSRKSRAITVRNVLSVLTTLIRTYWTLRMRRLVRPSGAALR